MEERGKTNQIARSILCRACRVGHRPIWHKYRLKRDQIFGKIWTIQRPKLRFFGEKRDQVRESDKTTTKKRWEAFMTYLDSIFGSEMEPSLLLCCFYLSLMFCLSELTLRFVLYLMRCLVPKIKKETFWCKQRPNRDHNLENGLYRDFQPKKRPLYKLCKSFFLLYFVF